MNSQPSALLVVSTPDGSGFLPEFAASLLLFCDRARDQLSSVSISFTAQAEKSIQFDSSSMPSSGGLNDFAGHRESSEKPGMCPAKTSCTETIVVCNQLLRHSTQSNASHGLGAEAGQ